MHVLTRPRDLFQSCWRFFIIQRLLIFHDKLSVIHNTIIDEMFRVPHLRKKKKKRKEIKWVRVVGTGDLLLFFTNPKYGVSLKAVPTSHVRNDELFQMELSIGDHFLPLEPKSQQFLIVDIVNPIFTGRLFSNGTVKQLFFFLSGYYVTI